MKRRCPFLDIVFKSALLHHCGARVCICSHYRKVPTISICIQRVTLRLARYTHSMLILRLVVFACALFPAVLADSCLTLIVRISNINVHIHISINSCMYTQSRCWIMHEFIFCSVNFAIANLQRWSLCTKT